MQTPLVAGLDAGSAPHCFASDPGLLLMRALSRIRCHLSFSFNHSQMHLSSTSSRVGALLRHQTQKLRRVK